MPSETDNIQTRLSYCCKKRMNNRIPKIYRAVLAGISLSVFLFALFPAAVKASSVVYISLIDASDPFYSNDSTQLDKQWYLAKTHIPEAWDYTRGSSNVIVAIVDTGIHASHRELSDGRVIAGFNTITNADIPAGNSSDDNGHGTAVAGVIGAIANNQQGIAGINWNISLMPIKAVGPDGVGEISAVAAGIIWATDHGANIINLSLGGTTFGNDNALSSAISYAYARNVLLIAAAGNDSRQQGINLDREPVYPVCGDNGQNMVLGVAATDINDRKADFSDYGTACIDISAPGSRILTTGYLPSTPSDNILIYASGTSLAVPVVSGIAALIKAANPNISNAEMHKRLTVSADDIYPLNQNSCGGTSCNGFLGSGRVNAQAALTPQPIIENSLVREASSGNIYLVSNSVKRLVTGFVFNQRGFIASSIINEVNGQLQNFAAGTPLPPLEGTLLKRADDPTVYVVNQELIRPLTYLVFVSRGFSFADVKTISAEELSLLIPGDWYWPPDGTLVLVEGDPTVFVMDQQVRRPVTFFVFQQRRLSFSRVVKVSLSDFSHVPVPPDAYWLSPLNGTLLKSDSEPTVYLVEGGVKHPLSYTTFVARYYSFRNIKTLPQVEVNVIAPGEAL